jgi:hypothetical protein
MKRSIYLIGVIILLTAGNIAAQEKKGDFYFGLHCSPNFSWIKPDVKEVLYKSDGIVIGVSYGADFEYDFTPNIGIITGLNFLHTGGKLQYLHIQEVIETNDTVLKSGYLSRKYNLQYLEIPIILKGSTGDLEKLGNFSFYGKFGITSGFNIRAKANDEFQPESSPDGTKYTNNKINVKDRVSFFREALIFGIGTEYKFGKKDAAHKAAVFLGLTFSNGFTDILKGNSTYNTAVKEKARSNFIEINAGIKF